MLMEWINALNRVHEIWRQSLVTGPLECVASLAAILKGESETAFGAALDDTRVNPYDVEVPFDLHIDHIEEALKGVTNIVFPHHALEVQKLWMTRAMRKPTKLSQL